jgi:hypothetical protein
MLWQFIIAGTKERFEGHKYPHPSPKNTFASSGGYHPSFQSLAQDLMWGARGPFPPAAAMVVAVVTPVVFCAKATEKRNNNSKTSWWLPKSLFITTCCKTY